MHTPTPRRPGLTLLALLAPAMLGGCEGGRASPATVAFRYQEVAPLTRDLLVITARDAGNVWYFEGTDLEPGDDGWLRSRSLRVSARAGVRISVSLRDDGERPAATGEATLPSTANEDWLVDIFPSSLAAEAACGGCAGLVRLSLPDDYRPAAHDWLYVRWTSTSSTPTAPR